MRIATLSTNVLAFVTLSTNVLAFVHHHHHHFHHHLFQIIMRTRRQVQELPSLQRMTSNSDNGRSKLQVHKDPPDSTTSIQLRNATLDDLHLLERWDQAEHMQGSIGDYEFNDWNWNIELPRQPYWRFQLVAELVNNDSSDNSSSSDSKTPIGFIQIIDPQHEETHYWGVNCEPNLRAIDIWIGEPDFLGKGYGTEMMTMALRDYCFSNKPGYESVQAVLVDPLADNVAAHRFYQRLGFRPEERIRFFGPDRCLVHRLDRGDFVS